MFIKANKKPLMIIQFAVIFSSMIHLVKAFDQCDVRGRFTNEKGKYIWLQRYNFYIMNIVDIILLKLLLFEILIIFILTQLVDSNIQNYSSVLWGKSDNLCCKIACSMSFDKCLTEYSTLHWCKLNDSKKSKWKFNCVITSSLDF